MRKERKSLFRLFSVVPKPKIYHCFFFFDFWVDMPFVLAIALALALIAVYITIYSNIVVSSERIEPTELKKKTFIRLVYLILMLVFTQPGFPVDFSNGFIAFRLQYFLFVSDSTIDMWRMSIKTNWKVLQPDELSATTTTANLILSEVQQQTMIWCFFHIQFHTSLNWSTKHSNNLYHCLVK